MDYNRCSERLIGLAIEVHRALGPGLLETVYEAALAYEIHEAGMTLVQQVAIPVSYKGVRLDCGLRLDLLVENSIVIEVKAVETLLKVHEMQLLTYLRMADKRLGLLINFNVPVLKDGLRRVANNL